MLPGEPTGNPDAPNTKNIMDILHTLALGDTPTLSIVAGNLPDGLTFIGYFSVIYGTLIKDGRFHFTVKAENPGGSDTREFSILIGDEVSPTAKPKHTPTPKPTATPSPSPTPGSLKSSASPSATSKVTASPSPSPSTPPASTPSPTPTPASVPETPSPTPAPAVIAPNHVEEEEDGSVVIEIDVSKLPEGTESVRLPGGEVVEITSDTAHFTIAQEDVGTAGTVQIVVLGDEDTPLGSYAVQVKGAEMSVPESKEGKSPLIWILIGIGVVGLGICVIYLVRSRKKPINR